MADSVNITSNENSGSNSSTIARGAAWRVDDFNSDLHRLNDLIAVICELRFELPVGEDDPRIDNLLWIAREIIEGLKDQHDRVGQFAI